MASTIDVTNIDADFPIAGVDNDSQGFRDNFNVIKQGLDFASSEITALQNGVARVDGDNDFDSNQLQNAELLAVSNTRSTSYSTGVTGEITCDWDIAQAFIIQATGDLELTMRRFATDTECTMRFYLFGNGSDRQVTFQSLNGQVATTTDFTSATLIVNSATAPTIVDAYTYNGGSLVMLNKVNIFTPVT